MTAEYLQKLLLQQPHTPPDARVLKVAVIGCPNAGKSSLVNMLVRWRVCAVAGKAHTTRSKQCASLMQENVQVVFVDLPGLVSKGKAWKFTPDQLMCEWFSRLFRRKFFVIPLMGFSLCTGDLVTVLVVIDVTHKRSREELDPEIIKALHYFEGKESILVLNKIDRAQGDPTRLLEVTRRLTNGTVHGRRSHLDAYENRFGRRGRLSSANPRIQPPNEVIAGFLPPVCHIEAGKLLAHLSDMQALLNPPPLELDASVRLIEISSPEEPALVDGCDAPLTEESSTQLEGDICESTLNSDNRQITDSDLKSIDNYFKDYTPEKPNRITKLETTEKQLTNMSDSNVDSSSNRSGTVETNEPYFDALMETLKEQLFLKTASKEEVAHRRQHWLDVSIATNGVTTWPGFSEVFMVSSATGEGVDRLRDCLVKKALPDRSWLMSPLLVTEHEPVELVRMCVWAHCLNRLRQEVPYALRIVVEDCEKVSSHLLGDEGDDRVFVHARIQCRSERHLRQVLGLGGTTIKELAGAVKLDLMSMFRCNTVVKLTVEMAGVNPGMMKQLRKAKDFAEVFPEQKASRS